MNFDFEGASLRSSIRTFRLFFEDDQTALTADKTISSFLVFTDPFIKVVLLFDGKKVKKKKTSTRKQETNPVYNECMMFDVPPDLLHRILLVISVADSRTDSARSDVIGRVVIGSGTTGESLRHWHQMLISPRRPVAAWHRLRL